MNEAGHEARADRDEPPETGAIPGPEAAASAPGEVRRRLDRAPGEVRRRLDRAPGERYRQPQPAIPGPSQAARRRNAVLVAIGFAVVTFALVTFDIGPGLLVVGIAGGWLTGLALAGGEPAGRGWGAATGRAALAAALGVFGIVGGLVLDAVRAYATGGVLLPWEYALERFGLVAPLAIVLAASAGWLRGR